ncbi:SusC/RagA family TonB-linked outer membrane protein [Fulvivirgaceae bacterium BMA10]|uniref:SusC/RagA family TonB-linked outer membrane protein n=1 Tax=Splendidivirga corallicola TaxID=3051826 RepID=A0ABT8KIK0_9BACT|nr:SusC/RagA family TonB-linked outer membrane protein [Fulvivirgaceae bacterium BMA10]
MRKKVRLFIVFLLAFGMQNLQAQDITVSGTVTSSEDQGGLPGVNVFIEGSSQGTVTDIDGKYSLQLPDGSKALLFSSIGYISQRIEIGNQRTINVALVPDLQQLSEVVVTALGIEREKASLGYAIQDVKGDDLTKVKESNFIGALTGKIAGVRVVSASGASIGGTNNIRIRGATDLNSGGSPLFVVDGTPISNDNFSDGYNGRDYGNLAQDINPDDIESVSVLKGPSAAALYGNRASAGVIVITTKSGSKRQKLGVDVSTSIGIDRVYLLPEYQNKYAGGYSGDFATFEYNPSIHPASWASFDGQKMLEYYADESWGPEMDGTLIRHWDSWYPGETFGELRPLSPQPDNVKNFYETGVTTNNHIAFSGGTEKTAFRLSFTNVNTKGVVPFSEGNRNNVGLNVNSDISDRFNVSTSINYANNSFLGKPAFGYTGSYSGWTLLGITPNLNMWTQRNLDYDRVRNYRGTDGSIRTWNINGPTDPTPNFWDNLYYMLENAFPEDSRDRIYGNINLTYEIIDGLKVSGIARRDVYNQSIERRIPSEAQTQDLYAIRTIKGQEENYEMLAKYDKRFNENFSLSASLGGNIRKNTFAETSMSTAGGLSTPNLFNIGASVDRPNVSSFKSEKIVRSIYGFANLGYKDMLYLDLTGRNDWSSSLPEDNNSYFYPSASLSFVFSEILESKILSFGKIRASVAQVGSDIDAFDINRTYSLGTAYGSNASFFVPNTLANQNLRPALATSYEFGLDVRFLDDRLGIDATYYKRDSKDQIINIDVPGSTGFNSTFVNAGLIRGEGIEIAAYGTPVKTSDFSWDVSFNVARNTSKVIELTDDIDNIQLFNRRGITANAKVGKEWGNLTGRYFQLFQATDGNGNPVDHPSNGKRVVRYASDGQTLLYNRAEDQDLGNVLPDYTGGITNTLRYKNFELSAFIDFQVGGRFHSVTNMYGFGAGQLATTVGLNDQGNSVRAPVSEGGGFKVEGVLADGTPVSGYASGSDHTWNLVGIRGAWVYDADYVKLREVRLGYNLPNTLLQKLPFSKVNVSLSAKNLWLISAAVPGVDPSEITPDRFGVSFHEGGGLPGVRTFLFTLNFGF